MRNLLYLLFALSMYATSAYSKPQVDAVNDLLNSDPLEIARGVIAGRFCINKFGRSTNVDSGVATDIWDRANSTHDQDIWIAPKQARKHDIVSTSTGDDGSPVGLGARTVRVYGLPTWDTAEVNELVTMDGTSSIATSNPYVIIHRIKVETSGASGPNIGFITATAQTDSTVTAQINEGEGQTQMAIYGIPSTQTAYSTGMYASVLRANLVTNERHADITLLFNPEPGDNANTFLTKHSTMSGTRAANPYKGFPGPGILKIQAAGSAADLDVSGGFDLILINN